MPAQVFTHSLITPVCQTSKNCGDNFSWGSKKEAVGVFSQKLKKCALFLAVIVILFVMKKRYHKDSLAGMKNSGEIHEQLVTYDEEGGGEMDTNGYVDTKTYFSQNRIHHSKSF